MKVGKLPEHVAIIMDGNRRWAKKRGLPVVAGHQVVVDKRIEELIEAAAEMGVAYITFWAWSCENWKRAEDEVGGIMNLFRWALKRKVGRFIKRGARLRVIGDFQALDKDIVADLTQAIESSALNDKITVTLAVNYGGRDELLRAVNKLQATSHPSTGSGQGKPQAIDKQELEKYLDTAGMPDPDLIIRTGGEQRLSGFMLWQSEYSELYFPETLMPDFGKQEFAEALEEYTRRQRRFGG